MPSRQLSAIFIAVHCFALSAAAENWSKATHQIAVGDFNADQRADLLVIARDPWRSSGLVLGDSSGRPAQLHQTWRGDHLGLDWSAERYQPVIGSFSRGRCSSGHMGTSCDYPDDLLLQSSMAGFSQLLFIDHATVAFNQLEQTIPDQQLQLGWSADKHRLITGQFDQDNYHDLFFQAAMPGGENALLLTTSLDGFPETATTRDSWSGRWAGLDWDATQAEVVSGDFNGDGLDDLLSQAYTDAANPFAPGLFGIVAGRNNGGFSDDGVEPAAYLSWARNEFLVPDWSATEYLLHVGNFNNDRYDDVLLQPRNGLGDAFVVFFGPGDSPENWRVTRLSAAAGPDWSEAAVAILVGDFDADGRDDLYLQPVRPDSDAQIVSITDSDSSGIAEILVNESPALVLDPVADPAVPDPGSAVGRITGEFSVDATGAARYQIPIAVPPGVRGMQPDLALSYHQRAEDEWLGEGWSLSGLPRIGRCGTVAEPTVDGFSDGVDLDAHDRYCLDGERLIETDVAGEYRTEVDSGRRIRSFGAQGNGPEHFVVEDRSGLIWEFGGTANSRIRPRGASVADAVLVYAVSRVRDRYGNGIVYSYQQDSGSTAFRPELVGWHNSDGVEIGQLHFAYAERVSADVGWFQGYRVSTPWRLRQIETRTLTRNAVWQAVRRYYFDYEFSAVSSRSFLARVIECEQSSGTCLGATQFDWEAGRRGFVSQAEGTGVHNADRRGLMLMDVDNNGINDHVYVRQNGPTDFRWTVRQDAIDGPVLSSSLAVDWDQEVVVPIGFRGIQLDYNGDGYADLVQASGDQDAAASRIQVLEGGSGGFARRTTSLVTKQRNFWSAGVAADIDGDGRSDLVTSAAGQVLAFRSLGDDFSGQAWTGQVPGTLRERALLGNTGEVLRPINFNSDGRTDLLAMAADCDRYPWVGRVCSDYQWLVYSLADPLATGEQSLQIIHRLPPGDYIRQLKLLDANGDGLTDLLFMHAGNARWELHVGTGLGFTLSWSAKTLDLALLDDSEGGPDSHVSMEVRQSGTGSLRLELGDTLLQHARVVDYDYDGRDDLIIQPDDASGLIVLLGSQVTEGFDTTGVATGIAPPALQHRQYLQLADVGGDGQRDLIFPGNDGRYRIFHARGAARGLLAGVVDGLGARTSIAYGLLRDGEVYAPGSADGQAAAASTFPYSRFSGPMSLVRETATATGLADNERVLTRYEYLGASMHRQGRGFAGFAERRAWNVNRQISTLNRYAQVFPLTGRVRESQQRIGGELSSIDLVVVQLPGLGLFEYPAACDTNPDGDECRQLFHRGPGTTLSALRGELVSQSISRFSYIETAQGAHGRSLLPIVDETTDLSFPATSNAQIGAEPKRRVTTTYRSATQAVDQFGNPSKIIVRVDNGRGGPAQVTTTTPVWENRVADWCIGLRAGAAVSQMSDGLPAVQRSRSFAYNSHCDLAEEVSQPGLANYSVRRQLQHDRHGNVVLETVSGGSFTRRDQSREFADSYHGRFATGQTNALDHVVERTWDERFGSPLSQLDSGPGKAAIERSVVRLDGFGRLLSRRLGPGGGRVEYSRSWCAETACRSAMAVTIQTSLHSDGQVETFERDALDRVVHGTRLNFDGEVIHTAAHFDRLGRNYANSMPYLESDAGRRCYALRQFDALARVVRAFYPRHSSDCLHAAAPPAEAPLEGAGEEWRYTYDLANGEDWSREVRRFSDGDLLSERTEVLDVMGQVVRVSEGDGAVAADSRYSYFSDGSLSEVIAADGSRSTFSYDPNGIVASMNDAGLGLRIYGHDALGQLTFERDGLGQLTRYDYDVLGRLVRRMGRWNYFSPQDPGQEVTDFVYDDGDGFAQARLARAIGPYRLGDGADAAASKIAYHYDQTGRLQATERRVLSFDGYKSYWTSQHYDDQGRLAGLTYPSVAEDGDAQSPGSERLRVSYEHNARGYLARVSDAATHKAYWEALSVDANGRFTGFVQDGGRLQTVRMFDRATGLMTGTLSSRGGETIQHQLYGWSSSGLLRSREDLLSDEREEIRHDSLQRLRAIAYFRAGQQVSERAFAYDAGGNPVGPYQAEPERPQAITAVDAGRAKGVYRYDGNGAMLQRPAGQLSWTSEGLPASWTSVDQQQFFQYGPHRQRAQREDVSADGSATKNYLGAATTRSRRSGQPVEMRQKIYVGREAIAQVRSASGEADQVAYLHKDFLGSTTAISRDDEISRIAYDELGMPRDPAQPFTGAAETLPSNIVELLAEFPGYTGHEHLGDSGLIHMNGRVFDARLGRFTAADPYVQFPLDSQGLNRYAYNGNRLNSATDPSGYGLRNFFRRLGKKLFFGAPFAIFGIGLPGGELFGLSVGGFMPHGGQSFPGMRPPVGQPGASDRYSLRREQLILSASEGTRLSSAAPRRLVSWRISQGLQGEHSIAGGGTQGVDISAAGFQVAGITDRIAGLLNPEIDSDLRRSPDRIFITGHRVGRYGPIHTAIEYRGEQGVFWLSAGPEGYGVEGFRALVGGVGSARNGVRQTDAPSGNSVLGEVQPPPGVSAQAYFGQLRQASEQFCDCVDYDLFPGLSGGYNSNGYVRGLIEATGGNTEFDFDDLVGGGRPVPPEFYGH